jgi:hypothetical protein
MVLSHYLLLFSDADYIFTSTWWIIGKILPHMSHCCLGLLLSWLQELLSIHACPDANPGT